MEEAKDTPRKEKKERVRSDVWQYFTKIDSVKASCQICDKIYSHSGNTTNLFWHLRRKHQVEVLCTSFQSPKNNSENSSNQAERVIPSRRGKSEVWRYFMKEDGKTARCLICDKVLSHSGNTSNLFSHVKHKHSDAEGNVQFGDIITDEGPSEILPDSSPAIITEIPRTTPTILRKKVKPNPECVVKYIEASDKTLEDGEKANVVDYEVVSLNGNTKFLNAKENGLSYITKVIPKASLGNSPVVIGEYDAVGLNVAAKLKKMDSNQAIYAESLINRILLRGLMENLSTETDLYDKNVFVIENLSNGRPEEAVACYETPSIEEDVHVTPT